MDKIIEADLYRYGGLTGTKGLLRGLRIPGFAFLFFLRNCSRFKKYSLLWILNNIMWKRYFYKYGIQIPRSTQIGKGFFIGHFGNIVINEKAVIGDNCNIAHGVTIGETNRGKLKGSPTIGNRVWIGTGSVIVGNIRIGDNVLIAPLTYVNFDIPDNSVAMGNPGTILPHTGAVNGYITSIFSPNQ